MTMFEDKIKKGPASIHVWQASFYGRVEVGFTLSFSAAEWGASYVLWLAGE